MGCDAEPYDLSSAVPHDEQSIEQTKRDCRHDEQIHRGDAIRMVAKESLPTLRRWFSPLDHILGHTGLPDFDAELTVTGRPSSVPIPTGPLPALPLCPPPPCPPPPA